MEQSEKDPEASSSSPDPSQEPSTCEDGTRPEEKTATDFDDDKISFDHGWKAWSQVLASWIFFFDTWYVLFDFFFMLASFHADN